MLKPIKIRPNIEKKTQIPEKVKDQTKLILQDFPFKTQKLVKLTIKKFPNENFFFLNL